MNTLLNPPARFDVTSTPRLSGGAECIVFDMEDGSVLKVYPYQECAQFAYENQKRAYRLGIAPKVLSDVERIEKNGYIEFGYVSEEAEVFTDDRDFDDMLATEEGTEFRDKVRSLCEGNGDMLDEAINWRNTGIIDGKLVLLDFGEISLDISGVVL